VERWLGWSRRQQLAVNRSLQQRQLLPLQLPLLLLLLLLLLQLPPRLLLRLRLPLDLVWLQSWTAVSVNSSDYDTEPRQRVFIMAALTIDRLNARLISLTPTAVHCQRHCSTYTTHTEIHMVDWLSNV